MSEHPSRPNHPVHDALHPVIYQTIVGLTVWLVLSVWLLFDRGQYVALNLAVITAFFLIVTAIPLLIALTWWRNVLPDEHDPPPQRFGEWIASDFSTWTGKLTGGEAAMQILLPIAAVAIGMTIFGLVFYFDVPHLS